MIKILIMVAEPKTKTFAEIYESQGHYLEALNIYIDLLKENPFDEESLDNIKRLQSLIKTDKENDDKKRQNLISALENFLQKTYAYKKSSSLL
ncbi:MAG: tetratricopeptide repeat protein [Candidatus Acidulodesulfobacterium sp.]